VLLLSAGIALFAAPRPVATSIAWAAALYPGLILALLYGRGDPARRLQASVLDIVTRVLGVTSLAAMLVLGASSVAAVTHPTGFVIRLWLFTTVYLSVARVAVLSIRRNAVSRGAVAIPTLLVGAGRVGEQLARRLMDDTRYGLRPVAFLDPDPLAESDREEEFPIPVLAGDLGLIDAVQRTGARHVIVAFSTAPDHAVLRDLSACHELGVQVSLVPRFYEAINQRATLDHVGGVPLLFLCPTDPRGWQFGVKHALDRTMAGVSLLLLSPLLAATALAVRLSCPGPVLFRQTRIGRDGHVFDLLKFRTMREPDAATASFEPDEGLAPGGVEGADRRTRLGRVLRELSLDELPQLINVLRGDMSIVGPRPERPEYVDRFVRDVARYEDRHRVKSGITGWAQVHGLRGQTSIADRVEWDNYYIQNWSLRLDLRIVALTIAEVLRFRG
jgi:exopolysaccharide biosynthesis polyprenyl glycosylphosphotransferase